MASIHQVVVDQESRREATKKKPAPETPATKRIMADDVLHNMLARIVRGEVPQDDAAAFIAIVGRAAMASAKQSKAESDCERTSAATPREQMNRVGSKANDAQRETCAAGAALAKALRALRKGAN